MVMFHFGPFFAVLGCFEFSLSNIFLDVFVCVISQEDCDVNKYFYGKLLHVLLLCHNY